MLTGFAASHRPGRTYQRFHPGRRFTMAVRNHDTAQGDGVAIGAPNLKGRVVVLPEKGDATDWQSYKDGQAYTGTALAHFRFRREVRCADGSSAVEEYDLQ